MIYWLLKHIFLGPLLRLVYRPKSTGLRNLPSEGPVILASNHISFVDSLFIPLAIKRPVVFLGKSDYFDKGRTRWFFKSVNVIPVKREGGTAGEAAIQAGVRALKDGAVVGTADVMPLDAKMPRPRGRVTVAFGKPLSFERYRGRDRDPFVLRSATDEIMYEIMMLSGQEYVDEYASRVKAQQARAAKAAARDGGAPEAEMSVEPAGTTTRDLK